MNIYRVDLPPKECVYVESDGLGEVGYSAVFCNSSPSPKEPAILVAAFGPNSGWSAIHRVASIPEDTPEDRIIRAPQSPDDTWSPLNSFIDYCRANPKQRFWQALRNWSGHYKILAQPIISSASLEDTFHWPDSALQHRREIK